MILKKALKKFNAFFYAAILIVMVCLARYCFRVLFAAIQFAVILFFASSMFVVIREYKLNSITCQTQIKLFNH